MTDHRFRPRYRGLAFGAIGGGVILGGLTLVVGALAAVGGVIGVALGVGYLLSPTWRIVVHVDDDALEVTARGTRRFRLLWGDVKEVVASPSTHSCFVDGGAPERSLLVPGDGAPAPYDIADKITLYDTIVAHVARDRVREVEVLQP